MSDTLLTEIFSLVDLTDLNDHSTKETIVTLCENAKGNDVAAVCVYPKWVLDAVDRLSGTGIKIATVANFPEGTESEAEILASVSKSLTNGANEIDVVFPYKRYLSGDKQGALAVMSAVKALVGKDLILKVILETGVLQDIALIETICDELIAVGVDFLKTSTGKVAIGATPLAAKAMLDAIKRSSRPVGFKASGGIRRFEDALIYVKLAEDKMGADWVTSKHFRIGTSGLNS